MWIQCLYQRQITEREQRKPEDSRLREGRLHRGGSMWIWHWKMKEKKNSMKTESKESQSGHRAPWEQRIAERRHVVRGGGEAGSAIRPRAQEMSVMSPESRGDGSLTPGPAGRLLPRWEVSWLSWSRRSRHLFSRRNVPWFRLCSTKKPDDHVVEALGTEGS